LQTTNSAPNQPTQTPSTIQARNSNHRPTPAEKPQREIQAIKKTAALRKLPQKAIRGILQKMEILRRKSCRALLLTSEDEILLIKLSNPAGNWIGWIAPGGGLEPGETEAQSLRRELDEELGFKKVENEIAVWKRFHVFPWNGKRVEQHEVFYLVKTEKFEPAPQANLAETEMLEFEELRWWKLEDLASSEETFAPQDLPARLKALIENGPPSEPIDVGV
jgi:8-oxo-dGTP pyrophosphatase MutT (NUDIX family)